MKEKRSKWKLFKAMVSLKCPSCYQGKLFSHANPYNLKHIADMPDTCTVCGLKFTPEPGFYYGAMFMSYVVTVALSVINFGWVFLIWGFAAWTYLIINTLILIVFMPYLFRVSRSFYLGVVYGLENLSRNKMH